MYTSVLSFDSVVCGHFVQLTRSTPVLFTTVTEEVVKMVDSIEANNYSYGNMRCQCHYSRLVGKHPL